MLPVFTGNDTCKSVAVLLLHSWTTIILQTPVGELLTYTGQWSPKPHISHLNNSVMIKWKSFDSASIIHKLYILVISRQNSLTEGKFCQTE